MDRDEERHAVGVAYREGVYAELLWRAANIMFGAWEYGHCLDGILASDMQGLHELVATGIHAREITRAIIDIVQPIQLALLRIVQFGYSCSHRYRGVDREGECRRGVVCIDKLRPLGVE